MPQDQPSTLYIINKDTIVLHAGELPEGYDTMSPSQQDDIRSLLRTLDPGYKNSDNTIDTSTGSDAPMYLFLAIIIAAIVLRFKANLKTGNIDNASAFGDEEDKPKKKNYLTYYGDELNFSKDILTGILIKRFPYFNKLNDDQKKIFIYRLDKFIKCKTFKIHDKRAFREMPVLISATAIQLTFGLENFLLPNFEFIHVYPSEFVRSHPTIRLLEGNVAGHSIHLSWKHFLEGFEFPDNGQNVGLHELAHALYYQAFYVVENADTEFRNGFTGFNNLGNKVFAEEKIEGSGIYSEYAMRNFQEFWAESLEIFFEKPRDLKARYPDLYDALTELLNQDPLSNRQ